MVQNRFVAGRAPEISLPSRRRRLLGIATAEIPVRHPAEAEVTRFQHWAMGGNTEIVEETMLNSNVKPLPAGIAIALMIGASLTIWYAIGNVLSIML